MRKKRIVTFVRLSALYLGVTTLIVALVYMIVNLQIADAVIKNWLAFMSAGTGLVFMSRWLNYNTTT